MAIDNLDFSRYQLGWSDDQLPVFKPKKGLNEAIVREMSAMKGEEPWMLNFRLDALKRFEKKPMLPWFADSHAGPRLQRHLLLHQAHRESGRPAGKTCPTTIKNTYERLGIPEAERKYLAGVTAQYESEVVFHRNREDLERLGVLFCDMDTAVREYPDLVRKYFGTIIPPNDNKFAALNSAVWSGGSFIYVPPGVKVDQPLQAYFRINTENMGQFERTLIIADEGSQVHYVEGCSAPVYSTDSLHSAVVELVALPGCAHHLHDDPELVEQRLQPRHQARPRRSRGPRRVDRRQHRLTPDHEVPVGLPDGPEGLGRGALGRLRRPRPGPRRRREDGPLRARDHLDDHLEVDLQGRRAHRVPRTREGRRGREGREELRALRRADPRRAVDLQRRGPTWRSASKTPRSATRRRCRRSATTSSST